MHFKLNFQMQKLIQLLVLIVKNQLHFKCKIVNQHYLICYIQDYNELQQCVVHCNKNKSLLRYFDLVEIIDFIDLVHIKDAIT